MLDLFKSFQQAGHTVVMVSHDMNQVLEYCDHVVVMNQGKVEKHCTVDELFSQEEYLSSLSIDLPIITHFINELNEQGFHLDHTIKDVKTLIDAIGGELRG
jgi:energy-coupling factor transport system ATP-binding protein